MRNGLAANFCVDMRLASCQPSEMKNRGRLIAARVASNLSQDDLAKLCGVTRWTINRIEKGKRDPSLSLMFRMIRATNGKISLDDFLPDASEKFMKQSEARNEV